MSIGRIFGIEIRLHWTFTFLVLAVIWANSSSGRGAVVTGLVWIVAVFGSVIVHELAHSVLARRRGATVRDILLTPIGGISQIEQMPKGPANELEIAAVGPAASFTLALVIACLGLAFGARMWPPALFGGTWFARLVWLNVILGSFNMLPALPMDGGRVLRALLSRHRDRDSATQLSVRIARVLAGAMVVVGFFYDLWLVIIGLFILLGANAEAAAGRAAQYDGDNDDDRTRT